MMSQHQRRCSSMGGTDHRRQSSHPRLTHCCARGVQIQVTYYKDTSIKVTWVTGEAQMAPQVSCTPQIVTHDHSRFKSCWWLTKD